MFYYAVVVVEFVIPILRTSVQAAEESARQLH